MRHFFLLFIKAMLNDRFVLFCSSTANSKTKQLVQELGAKAFPYIAALHVPIVLSGHEGKEGELKRANPELLGWLDMMDNPYHLEPGTLLTFLVKVIILITYLRYNAIQLHYAIQLLIIAGR